MKIRTIRYIVTEGIMNTIKNKIMSLASISIVMASLIIFGMVYLVSVNLNRNAAILNEQPEMEVFCYTDLQEEEIQKVETDIASNPEVKKYTVVTKEEAFEKAKSLLGDNEKLLEGEDSSFLPVSFVLQLKDPQKSAAVYEQMKQIEGVEDVAYSKDAVEILMMIKQWIRFASTFLILTLLLISMFIISNTIRLTVFARRKEISIMKYIGATDWFIRWPFIIEGVLIGLAGAMVAFIFTSYGYSSIESWGNQGLLKVGLEFISFIKIKEIAFHIIGFYSIIGGIVGILGSAISLRKHLHV